jgi:hypothetical protein
VSAALKAVQYALHRAQTDPDFHDVCCPFTQTFALLCEAEAELTGRNVEEVKATRRRHSFGERPSRRQELQERVEELEQRLANHGGAL